MSAPDSVYRVEWYAGSDDLLGTCHCGATRLGDDPVAMWQWLHEHPDGHEPAATAPASRLRELAPAS